MIKNLIDANIELFTIFKTEEWDRCQDPNIIAKTFQLIADLLVQKYYGTDIPNLCTVKVQKLHSPSKKGEFDPETNTLYIEHELSVNKLRVPYYYNGNPVTNYTSNIDSMEVFLHELRHAMQHYERTHQISNPQVPIITAINYESGQNEFHYAYFSITNSPAHDTLYYIQPTERDAFLFAEQTVDDFINAMNQKYPEDLAFRKYKKYSPFQDAINNAIIYFDTQTPFEDIDNIVRHINGIEPSKPLNKEMWQAVQDSQKKEPKGRFFGRFFDEEINHTHEEELDLIEEECGDREL